MSQCSKNSIILLISFISFEYIEHIYIYIYRLFLALVELETALVVLETRSLTSRLKS